MQRMDILIEALDTNERLVQMALNDLDDKLLNSSPKPDCNSIGWTLWHQTRTEDAIISLAKRAPQIWVDGGWHMKFAMEADPKNTGLLHTPEQVAAFKAPDVQTLTGYAAAVRASTKEFLNVASEADLSREVPSALTGQMKVSSFLARLIVDHFQHSGQICYLRGLFTGRGWLPF